MNSTGAVTVRTAGLTKRFGQKVALEALDLELREGEVFGFLGPNGAGKTTTVKLLLGLVRPSAGEVFLFGERLQDNFARFAARIGAMVEAPAFYPYLGGRDNLSVFTRMAGLPVSRADAALETVGLTGAAKQRFGSYSVGMKQRLGLAAALLREPRLVILDEPTSGLDPAGQRDVCALIPRLASEGRTVFLSSHLMHEVQQLCTRVAILKEGRLLSTGTVQELTRGRPAIEIEVADPASAAAILRALPWIESVAAQETGLVVETAAQPADLTRVLAEAGHYVTAMRQLVRSLESVYLEVTSAEAAA